MKIDKTVITKLADLAKLEFNAKDKNEITNDLNKIVTFVKQLDEVNTDGVEPLIYINENQLNILREDDVEVSISQKEGLKNAPLKDSDYIKIPKVLKK